MLLNSNLFNMLLNSNLFNYLFNKNKISNNILVIYNL
jgi:hypothetical protein